MSWFFQEALSNRSVEDQKTLNKIDVNKKVVTILLKYHRTDRKGRSRQKLPGKHTILLQPRKYIVLQKRNKE